jgi:hypothetical protein
MLLERRIFSNRSQRELVYFGGLVGGQPLPYRLDHNLPYGLKHALSGAKDKSGSTLPASDKRFWGRVWEAFLTRRPLTGPKQFLRVSTPIGQDKLAEADLLLESFLSVWLQPVAYQQELTKWLRSGHKH